jgi:hypothetical protein
MTACVLAAAALLAGCQSDTDGTATSETITPIGPTEPTVATPKPTRSVAPSEKVAVPPPAPPPPAAEALQPENGYVFIQTKSGQTRCQISALEVGCEAPFTGSPVVDGAPANGVRATSDGQIRWVLGNLGDIPAVTIDYRTYSAVGWTIVATSDGTRFTNDGTGHGVFVAIEKVESF